MKACSCGRPRDEVYPDPLARRDALQDTKATPDATVSGILAARELRSMNNALFPRLQLLVVTALSEEYNKGARNSPIWKQMMTTTFAGT